MLSLRTRPLGLVLVPLVLIVTRASYAEVDDDPFQEEVVHCEEALAKLTSCCPDFEPEGVLCNYRHEANEGCGSGTVDNEDPVFAKSESRCIRAMSCEVLRATKVCERAQAAKPYRTKVHYEDGGRLDGGSSKHAPVCP